MPIISIEHCKSSAKFVVPIQKSIDIKEPVEDKVFEIDVLDGKGEVTDTYVSVFKGE